MPVIKTRTMRDLKTDEVYTVSETQRRAPAVVGVARATDGRAARLSAWPGSRSSRLVKRYAMQQVSEDWLLDYGNEEAINLSRALHRSSGIVAAMIERYVDIVVGEGWRILPERTLPREAPERRAVAAYERWLRRDADHRRLSSGYELQRMAVRERVITGDSITLWTSDGTLQTVEAEQIGSDWGKGSDDVIMGVRLDEHGRPMAYNVWQYQRVGGHLSRTENWVDARHVMMVSNRVRPSQTRGRPLLLSVAERIAQIENFHEATVVAAQIAAMFAAAIETSEQPGTGFAAIANAAEAVTDAVNATSTSVNRLPLEIGTILELMPGQKITTLQGNQPTQGFDALNETALRIIAAAIGAPMEVLLFDATNANFSAMRSLEYAGNESAKPVRRAFFDQRERPIYERWLARQLALGDDGLLDPTTRAAGFERLSRVRFLPAAREVLDAAKEAAGWRGFLEINAATTAEMLATYGDDFYDTMDSISRERAAMAERGISQLFTPGGTPAGQAPSERPTHRPNERPTSERPGPSPAPSTPSPEAD